MCPGGLLSLYHSVCRGEVEPQGEGNPGALGAVLRGSVASPRELEEQAPRGDGIRWARRVLPMEVSGFLCSALSCMIRGIQ